MKTTIGVYDNHDLAINAVMELKNAGFPVKNISIMGRAETEVVDEDMHITLQEPIKVGGVAIGAALGATVGALTGVGLFAIPGLGILVGAGALVGAIAGFDFGLLGGGIATVLINLGLHSDEAKKYQDYLHDGKFLLIINGGPEHAEKAHEILEAHGTQIDLSAHDLAVEVNEAFEAEREANRKLFFGDPNKGIPAFGGGSDDDNE